VVGGKHGPVNRKVAFDCDVTVATHIKSGLEFSAYIKLPLRRGTWSMRLENTKKAAFSDNLKRQRSLFDGTT